MGLKHKKRYKMIIHWTTTALCVNRSIFVYSPCMRLFVVSILFPAFADDFVVLQYIFPNIGCVTLDAPPGRGKRKYFDGIQSFIAKVGYIIHSSLKYLIWGGGKGRKSCGNLFFSALRQCLHPLKSQIRLPILWLGQRKWFFFVVLTEWRSYGGAGVWTVPGVIAERV